MKLFGLVSSAILIGILWFEETNAANAAPPNSNLCPKPRDVVEMYVMWGGRVLIPTKDYKAQTFADQLNTTGLIMFVDPDQLKTLAGTKTLDLWNQERSKVFLVNDFYSGTDVGFLYKYQNNILQGVRYGSETFKVFINLAGNVQFPQAPPDGKLFDFVTANEDKLLAPSRIQNCLSLLNYFILNGNRRLVTTLGVGSITLLNFIDKFAPPLFDLEYNGTDNLLTYLRKNSLQLLGFSNSNYDKGLLSFLVDYGSLQLVPNDISVGRAPKYFGGYSILIYLNTYGTLLFTKSQPGFDRDNFIVYLNLFGDQIFGEDYPLAPYLTKIDPYNLGPVFNDKTVGQVLDGGQKIFDPFLKNPTPAQSLVDYIIANKDKIFDQKTPPDNLQKLPLDEFIRAFGPFKLDPNTFGDISLEEFIDKKTPPLFDPNYTGKEPLTVWLPKNLIYLTLQLDEALRRFIQINQNDQMNRTIYKNDNLLFAEFVDKNTFPFLVKAFGANNIPPGVKSIIELFKKDPTAFKDYKGDPTKVITLVDVLFAVGKLPFKNTDKTILSAMNDFARGLLDPNDKSPLIVNLRGKLTDYLDNLKRLALIKLCNQIPTPIMNPKIAEATVNGFLNNNCSFLGIPNPPAGCTITAYLVNNPALIGQTSIPPNIPFEELLKKYGNKVFNQTNNPDLQVPFADLINVNAGDLLKPGANKTFVEIVKTDPDKYLKPPPNPASNVYTNPKQNFDIVVYQDPPNPVIIFRFTNVTVVALNQPGKDQQKPS